MEPISLHTATRDSSLGTATINTLNALYRSHEGSRTAPETWPALPTFIPAATTLIASGASLPDGAPREFMREPTSGARAAAISNAYDSIVAGPLSEASNGEFTDVGLWLGRGHYPRGQEKAVLASLGLEEWMQCSGAKLTSREFAMPAKCIEFSSAYRNLKDAHSFCISESFGGAQTACFLVGELDHQWCGLASIATTSD